MRVLLAVLVVAVAVPAAWGLGVRAQVRLVDSSPATVSGVGFAAREHVVVTVTAGSSRLSKALESGVRGTFTARFGKTLPASNCGQVAIAAVGARGDRATWKSVPQSCGTPLQPVTNAVRR